VSQVAIRVQLAVPPNDVNIVWHIAEFPRFGEISRHKRKEYSDRKAEPEVCGVKEEVVITESVGRKPTRRDHRINRCVDPYEDNTNEYGKEDPSGPDISVQTCEQAGYHDG